MNPLLIIPASRTPDDAGLAPHESPGTCVPHSRWSREDRVRSVRAKRVHRLQPDRTAYAFPVPRGYMEGPASEEAERLADEAADGVRERTVTRVAAAVYGCTTEDPEPHFLGWRSDVDPDRLFESGAAWGVTVRRIARSPEHP
jgi:hypothetical protein